MAGAGKLSDISLKRVLRPSWEKSPLYTQRKRASLSYYGQFVFLQNLYIETQYDGIRRWNFWAVIRIRWGHEGGVLMNGVSGLLRVTRVSALCHERIQRSRWSTTLKRTLTMPAPWSQISSLQNCEREIILVHRLPRPWYFCHDSWS